MIQPERIAFLNSAPARAGRFVLYWMQASQRARYNHALEYAIERANELNKPLVVSFGLLRNYPEANIRHYAFMLEGLREIQAELARRGIKMVAVETTLPEGIIQMAEDACLLVTDRGYLRHQKKWRAEAARKLDCSMIQVETDVVVPVETASEKEEYAAATIRPKIHQHLKTFLIPLKRRRLRRDSLGLPLAGVDLALPTEILRRLKIGAGVGAVTGFRGGTSAAEKLLRQFIKNHLEDYVEKRNDPNANVLSGMSPYLHFGQISPLYIALQVGKKPGKNSQAYLEELIVRRELALNFVSYNRHYDRWACLPHWAQATLRFHRKDKRTYVYTREELETAQTHDPYWNAAQKQMVREGKMHGYMRMYWGKKILEWTRSPQKAYEFALYLNNKYELDGRDPNGYAGVAWCFGKHDRPWASRPIFGNVRYMNEAGLKRKFNADAYATRYE